MFFSQFSQVSASRTGPYLAVAVAGNAFSFPLVIWFLGNAAGQHACRLLVM